MNECPFCQEQVQPPQLKMIVTYKDGSEVVYHRDCGEISVFRRANLT